MGLPEDSSKRRAQRDAPIALVSTGRARACEASRRAHRGRRARDPPSDVARPAIGAADDVANLAA